MTLSRWQTVSHIFEAALDVPANERDNFVREACAGDAELESEVHHLIVADGKAGSFLEHPALSTLPALTQLPAPALLHAGTVVAGRFQIVRFIGQGGMGQVYEALDLELNSRIALKAIRPEIASDPRMLSRFRREVQLTRMITHPSVCRTFDIERHILASGESGGEAGNLTFLTMELLEGETLSARLRREGRLTPAEALPLVLQMIDALNAAHAVGVIHRDFKPSNVLLVPGVPVTTTPLSAAESSNSNSSSSGASSRASRVVVTDFGLARALATETQPSGPMAVASAATSLTGDQALMGTLVYMAPEQFERGEASIASDIYSLGLVMFEMVTGRRPFADGIPFAEAAKRLKQPAPSTAKLVPDLAPAWDAAISCCLALDPKDRFGSVRQIAEALADLTEAKRARATEPAAHSVVGSPDSARGHKILFASALVVVVVSLFVFIFRHYWMKAEEAKLAEGSTVLLTNIQNGTGDKRFDDTTELVRHQLLQSPYFSLMDSGRIHKTLAEMLKPDNAVLDPQTAREVAMRNGVRRVVFGAASRVGDSYVLDLDIEQPDNSPLRFRHHWEHHWTWSMPAGNSDTDLPSGFLDAIRDSSDWMRREIGESANDIAREDVPPEDVTTSKWEALSEFAQAEQFRASGQSDSAVKALQNAVSADPNFALAYARLGDIFVSLSRFAEGYAAYDKALALGKQRLTRRERDRIRGIYASDTWDYATAEATFRDYATYYPNDYLGWFYRAYPLMMMGHVEEAIASLRKAQEIDPSKQFAPALIARLDLMSGNYRDASKTILDLRNRGYQDTAGLIEGELKFLQSRYEEARGNFDELKGSKDPLFRSYSYSVLARLFAEQGHYASALQSLERGIANDLESGDAGNRADKILDRAYIRFKQGNYEACLQDTKLALELDRSLQRSLSAATILGQAANEVTGRMRSLLTAQLREIEAKLPSGDFNPFSDIVRFHLRGEALLAEGNWNLAVQEFRKADRLEAPLKDKEYLGRSLVAAAEHSSDNAVAARLREEAVAAYSNLAVRNGLVWEWPFFFPPGYQADSSFSLVETVARNGRLDQQTKTFLAAYLRCRASADASLRNVEQAKRLEILAAITNAN
jgi:serine/threonine protein kinase/tetratricopeptide (TPR) repeat protein